MQTIFPEYLIRAINQQMGEKKLEKEFALVTLNNLKKFYLEIENPKYLAKLTEKVDLIRKKITDLRNPTPGKKLDGKGLKKAYDQLIEVYKEMGDLQQWAAAEKEWKEIEPTLPKK